MGSITIRPLREDLPYGARISGVTREVLGEEGLRQQIFDVFEDRGMIVFENVEQTGEMQVLVSEIIGPLKEHPIKTVQRADAGMVPGVIVISNDPKADRTVVEVGGKILTTWQPWHFDHCYNNELNRAGVLRAIQIPPEGGLTGFADGIDLYNAFSPTLREAIEGENIVYALGSLLLQNARFCLPKDFKLIDPGSNGILELSKTIPRAVHPAVWTRSSGEKVLHVTGWGAEGIEGREQADGDELLQAVCEEIEARVNPYFHQWQPGDMVAWDNWRMLHRGCGVDPKYPRVLHRTTIKGDYGLGYWEGDRTVDRSVPEMM